MITELTFLGKLSLKDHFPSMQRSHIHNVSNSHLNKLSLSHTPFPHYFFLSNSLFFSIHRRTPSVCGVCLFLSPTEAVVTSLWRGTDWEACWTGVCVTSGCLGIQMSIERIATVHNYTPRSVWGTTTAHFCIIYSNQNTRHSGGRR